MREGEDWRAAKFNLSRPWDPRSSTVGLSLLKGLGDY